MLVKKAFEAAIWKFSINQAVEVFWQQAKGKNGHTREESKHVKYLQEQQPKKIAMLQ